MAFGAGNQENAPIVIKKLHEYQKFVNSHSITKSKNSAAGTVLKMTEILISGIRIGIALISLLIVLWDHYKDDRLLTKRVQSFYKDIENLLFYDYTTKHFRGVFDKNKENEDSQKKFFNS